MWLYRRCTVHDVPFNRYLAYVLVYFQLAQVKLTWIHSILCCVFLIIRQKKTDIYYVQKKSYCKIRLDVLHSYTKSNVGNRLRRRKDGNPNKSSVIILVCRCRRTVHISLVRWMKRDGLGWRFGNQVRG